MLGETDRFELEQALMGCWQTADDIKLAVDAVIDGEDEDTVVNTLLGIETLHNLRMQKTMRIFEALVALGEIKSPHVVLEKTVAPEKAPKNKNKKK